jgi:hypothetical protein
VQVEEAEMEARRGEDLDAEDVPAQRLSSSNKLILYPQSARID